MGWRGTIRSTAAASRRIERAQHRKRAELMKRQQQIAKLGDAQRAALEVATYENGIDLITSIHRDCGETWDWNSFQSVAAPAPPEYSSHLEEIQRQREQMHQPGFLDRLLDRADAKRIASELAIAQAKAEDQARYNAALKEYEGRFDEWKALQQIAGGVVAGEVPAFKEALEELNPFAEIKELGRKVQFSFNQRYAEATVSLYGLELVPREIKSLLKSGKVSNKPASDSFIHQTYQTHVCSCVLRAARELFAVLPFQAVYVHGRAEILNPQTGHKEPQVIVSVLMPRRTFSTLNFESLDPVDCMRNFVHQMSFSKLRGFSPVGPINPKDYETTIPPA